MIFRLIDHVDKEDRLHNGYQILYTGGDFAAAINGLVSVKLIDELSVLVSIPAVPNSMLQHTSAIILQMKTAGHPVECVENSYNTAVSKLLSNQSRQLVHFLVKFDKTGETLTNEVFSPNAVPDGPVQPFPIVFEGKQQCKGKHYKNTEMYAAYNIARVEDEDRMAKVQKPKAVSDNLLLENLGMTFDNDSDDDTMV